MIVYWIMMALSLPLAKIDIVQDRASLYSSNSKFRQMRYCGLFAILPFFFVSAFRYNVGTDYRTYLVEQFPRILAGQYNLYEPLFTAIVLFVNSFFGNFQWVYIIFSGLFCVFAYKYINYWSCNVALSFYLLFTTCTYNMSMNMIRQMVAVMIFFAALRFIAERNWKKYTLYILIASLFHYSAIIYFPLYFILKKQWFTRIWNYIIALCLGYATLPFLRNILYMLSEKTGFYIRYYGGKYDTGVFSNSLVLINLIAFILFSLTIFHSEELKNKIIFQLQWIALFLSIIMTILPNGARVVFMFMPIQIAGFTIALKEMKNSYIRIVCEVVIIILYAAFWWHYIYINNMGETLPYRSIFS